MGAAVGAWLSELDRAAGAQHPAHRRPARLALARPRSFDVRATTSWAVHRPTRESTRTTRWIGTRGGRKRWPWRSSSIGRFFCRLVTCLATHWQPQAQEAADRVDGRVRCREPRGGHGTSRLLTGRVRGRIRHGPNQRHEPRLDRGSCELLALALFSVICRRRALATAVS